MVHRVSPDVRKFRALIWRHYRRAGRHALPWRVFPRSLPAGRRAYRIAISEIMLQQTQVARVLLFYPKFLKQFPSFRALAAAPRREVLKAWQGLGYNRRAVSLHRLAGEIVHNYKGKLPRDSALLEELPGLGAATVGAILAFAFNIPTPFVETNIRRAFLHHFFPRRSEVREKEIIALVAKTLPRNHSREWYYALMDYGSWLAKREPNPNRRAARYRRQPKFEGSSRELRGKMVKYLITHPRTDVRGLARALKEPAPRVRQALATLKREEIL